LIRLKNEAQIGKIRQSCKLLSAMYRELVPKVTPGVATIDIDKWVENWIRKSGGTPAFMGYGPKKAPYPASICISINDEVIHGVPSRRKIRSGDLVSLDCGIILDGFFSDQAITVEAGSVAPELHALNVTTRECLHKGIAAAIFGDRLHQIGRAVESHACARGYGVVSTFCGHGVGFDLHEDPQVSNCPHGGANPRMHNGLVIAIEPMINIGTPDVEELEDGWTIVTADGKASAHWEHTLAIIDGKTEVLTDEIECGSCA
jgi:methionyl aminopeptidase